MYQKSIKNSLTLKLQTILVSSIFVGLLGISGCNSDEVDKIIEMASQIEDANKPEPYCQAKTVPFTHTLCSVTQEDLIEPDSPLSLRLFWKSAQWQEMSDSQSNNQTLVAETETTSDDVQADKKPLYTFNALLDDLPQTSKLEFAFNAGMYNNNFAPIGYTVIEGKQVLSLNLNEGYGNFHLLPNGVFWWSKTGDAHITESHEFNTLLQDNVANPWYATQSGPMLVIDNSIHPKFNIDSKSKKVRNGVGVCDDGNIKFVTTNEAVNFYEFAQLFKEELRCPNALFLDGGVASAIYAPNLNKKDNKNMGVIVGLVNTPKIK